jgi:hypothetical protein
MSNYLNIQEQQAYLEKMRTSLRSLDLNQYETTLSRMIASRYADTRETFHKAVLKRVLEVPGPITSS